ncbi:MAG: type II secretion system protein GspL [bacterium]
MIYIRPSQAEQASSYQWARLNKGTLTLCDGQIPDNAQVTIIVPAVEVHMSQMACMTRQRHKLVQAAPYVIEDQLAEDLVHVDVGVGSPDQDKQLSIAAIGKQTLKKYQLWAEQNQWKLIAIIPEQSLIKLEEKSVFVLEDVLVFRSEGEIVSLDTALFKQMLQMKKIKITDIESLYGDKTQAQQLKLYLSELGVEGIQLKATNIWSDFELDEKNPKRINFLYQQFKQVAPWLFRFGGFSSVSIVVLIIAIASAGWYNNRLTSYADQLWDKQVAVAKTAFPEIKRMTNPRVQAQQSLDTLLLASGQDLEGGVLTLLGSLGEALNAVPDTEILSFSYQNNELEVKLHAQGVPQLDQLRQYINKQKASENIQAVLGNINNGEQGVEGFIRIKQL